MKQKFKNGWEWDWVYKKARRVHNWGSGVGKSIKTRLNRRVRREGKCLDIDGTMD